MVLTLLARPLPAKTRRPARHHSTHESAEKAQAKAGAPHPAMASGFDDDDDVARVGVATAPPGGVAKDSDDADEGCAAAAGM